MVEEKDCCSGNNKRKQMPSTKFNQLWVIYNSLKLFKVVSSQQSDAKVNEHQQSSVYYFCLRVYSILRHTTTYLA